MEERAKDALIDLLDALDGVLARMWLSGPPDSCPACGMAAECFERSRCLHLVASVGTSTRTDGPYRRFPLGARQVGHVAASGRPFVASGPALRAAGLADPAWLSLHGVSSFVAVPVAERTGLRGVLGLFSRRALADRDARALTAVAGIAGALLAADRHPPPTLADAQRVAIERALALTGGRVSGPRGAAVMLGLKPTTLASRMLKLGVRRRRPQG